MKDNILNVGDMVRLSGRSWKGREYKGILGVVLEISKWKFYRNIYEVRFTGHAPSYFERHELVKISGNGRWHNGNKE